MSLKYITDFHAKVKANPKQFCKKIKIQCQRIDKLLKRKGIEYCESDVNAFVKMAGLFSHWKGKKTRIILDDDQLWEIACVLGIKHQDKDGDWVRYFKEYRVFCGKKRGKSVVMALLGIWGLAFDRFNDGAEVYCIATKKSQAKIVYDNAVVYRKQNIEISKLIKEKYADGSNYLLCEKNNGVFKYLSSSDKGIQGLNTNIALFDEAQEVTKFAVIDAVRTSMATKKQPLLVAQSTAGVTANSAFHKMYAECEALIESGEHNGIFFAIYELDIDDDPSDVKNWIKPNPSLGRGRPSLEYLQKEYNSALIGLDGNSMPTFLAFHLNRACDGAQTYFTTELLKKCVCDITDNIYFDTYAFGGSDLAEFTDLANKTSLIPYWHGDEDGTFTIYILQRYFAPEKRIDRNSDTDKVLYRQFTNTKSKCEYGKELLRLCQGDIVNFNEIASDFKYDETQYEMLYLKNGYDKWKSGQLLIAMKEFGFTEEKRMHNQDGSLEMRDDGVMTEVRQGKYLSPEIKLLKVLMESGRIKFDRSNVLFPMCCTNAKVSIDKDNLYSVEKRHSRGRIDGLMGVLIALKAFNCYKDHFLKNILPYETRNKLIKE